MTDTVRLDLPRTDYAEMRGFVRAMLAATGAPTFVDTNCQHCDGTGFKRVRRGSERFKRCTSCAGTGQFNGGSRPGGGE